MGKEVAGCDPKPGSRHQTNGGETARVHRELSLAARAALVLRGGFVIARLRPARRQPTCVAATRRWHWSWPLAPHISGSPPTPICTAQSLGSLAKLRLPMGGLAAQASHAQLAHFATEYRNMRFPHAVRPPCHPNGPPYNRRLSFRAVSRGRWRGSRLRSSWEASRTGRP